MMQALGSPEVMVMDATTDVSRPMVNDDSHALAHAHILYANQALLICCIIVSGRSECHIIWSCSWPALKLRLCLQLRNSQAALHGQASTTQPECSCYS